jgi:hypothetical protein
VRPQRYSTFAAPVGSKHNRMPSGATRWRGGRYVESITWDLAPTANPKFPAPIGYWPLHLPLLGVKQVKRFLPDQPEIWQSRLLES